MRNHLPAYRWTGSSDRCFRPRVERMEVRALLATFTVNSTVDAVDADPGGGTALTASGQITLRSAIQEANALAGGDTIVLPAGNYTLTIPGTGENGAATGDLDLTGDLTITGAGAGTTIVDGGQIDRVFDIKPAVNVSIIGVTIQNGETPDASVSPTSSDGGGIDNTGNLTLTDCVVQDNVAGALLVNGQPSQNAFGGGISNGDSQSVSGNETLVLDHTVVSGNKADGGGGIENFAGTVTVRDSSIEGNSAVQIGGGISTGGIGGGGPFVSASVSVLRSTVSNNSSVNQGAGINVGTGKLSVVDSTVSGNAGAGVFITFRSNGLTDIDSSTITNNAAGGISAGAAINLANSIVAGNTPFDVAGLITSQGYNLMQSTSSATISGVTTGNILGQDAKLGPLADNGGPTQTHLLLAGSPAMDAGNPSGETDPDGNLLTVDQRGLSRTVGPASDIGPVENQASAPLIATTTAIASSANPSMFGQSVTFTATVTTASGNPGGTVNFLDGGIVLGTGILDPNGIAAFATTTLGVGSHTMTAAYIGDTTHQASTSSPLNQVVNPNSTTTASTTTLSSSLNPSTLGQSVTFTARVAGPGGSGAPTGTVTFLEGQTVLGTSPLNASGVTAFITSTLSVGGHAITASYGGDRAFLASVSVPLAQVVNTPTTPFADLAVVQTASAPTVTVGNTLIYTVTVTDFGPNPADGIVLSDVLPAGMTFVSASTSQGTVTPFGGTLTADLGGLTTGAMTTLTVVVVPTTSGPVINTTRVSGAEADPVPGNNMTTLTTVVEAPSAIGDGPTVIGLRRFGFHWMPTTLVLTFSAALDPAKAQDPANYALIGPLPGHRVIPIVSALYDASTHSITLSPVHRLNVHNWYRYRLSVSGAVATGLTDTSGKLMDGDHDGKPGGDYLVTFHGFGPKPAVAGVLSRGLRPFAHASPTRHASRA
jgi:uncharacterized repeat protein (TIGR01451 family)